MEPLSFVTRFMGEEEIFHKIFYGHCCDSFALMLYF